MDAPKARLRVDFAPGCSLGPGKVALLEAIAEAGSLSAGARKVRMSYRRAWLLLHDVNTAFAEPSVRLSVGGKAGGGAELTPFGQRLVASYREFEAAVQGLSARAFRGVSPAPQAPAAETGSAPRRLQRSVADAATTRRSRG